MNFNFFMSFLMIPAIDDPYHEGARSLYHFDNRSMTYQLHSSLTVCVEQDDVAEKGRGAEAPIFNIYREGFELKSRKIRYQNSLLKLTKNIIIHNHV